MVHTIAISEFVFARLDEEARRNHLSPNELAGRLLAERLGVDQQVWRAQMAELLARMHERMGSFEPADIESDIAAAAAEVKAQHHTGRRSALHQRLGFGVHQPCGCSGAAAGRVAGSAF